MSCSYLGTDLGSDRVNAENSRCFTRVLLFNRRSEWLAPGRPHANPPGARPRASSSPSRLRASGSGPASSASRNRPATGRAPSPSGDPEVPQGDRAPDTQAVVPLPRPGDRSLLQDSRLALKFRSPWMCHYLCMPRQRIGCQKRAVLGGHGLMLARGTHGTLLCSDGDFEAISGCRAPFCALHQKRGSMGRGSLLSCRQ